MPAFRTGLPARNNSFAHVSTRRSGISFFAVFLCARLSAINDMTAAVLTLFQTHRITLLIVAVWSPSGWQLYAPPIANGDESGGVTCDAKVANVRRQSEDRERASLGMLP
jgi:hypothetical protein